MEVYNKQGENERITKLKSNIFRLLYLCISFYNVPSCMSLKSEKTMISTLSWRRANRPERRRRKHASTVTLVFFHFSLVCCYMLSFFWELSRILFLQYNCVIALIYGLVICHFDFNFLVLVCYSFNRVIVENNYSVMADLDGSAHIFLFRPTNLHIVAISQYTVLYSVTVGSY